MWTSSGNTVGRNPAPVNSSLPYFLRGFFYISGGAGFLPSTVLHQPFTDSIWCTLSLYLIWWWLYCHRLTVTSFGLTPWLPGAWQCASCLARNSCMGSWLKSREGSAHCTKDVKTSGLVNCLQNFSPRWSSMEPPTKHCLLCVCVLTIMQVRNCNWHDKLVALESISIISASKVLEHDAPKKNTAEGSYIFLNFGWLQ